MELQRSVLENSSRISFPGTLGPGAVVPTVPSLWRFQGGLRAGFIGVQGGYMLKALGYKSPANFLTNLELK